MLSCLSAKHGSCEPISAHHAWQPSTRATGEGALLATALASTGSPSCPLLQYYMTGFAVNEMTSSDWSDVVPGSNQTIGSLALQSRWVGRFVCLSSHLFAGARCACWYGRSPRGRFCNEVWWLILRPANTTFACPFSCRPCSGFKQSYDYVWIAIFVWGVGACCINFGECLGGCLGLL